ncbi:DUF262 domain-containing protein [Micromonospora ureilytica]|uniref:GmrSD restriction endonucleases N-terminal domain-containing protein n=1 Tax=Micromonospora ureilytica TaxID=709868 RepID=A0ABS0JQ66_9ACTN|nr:DUF262 domain-containing protein [Micromonospora ureilytica]MBG6069179.1 hypothetical protein [Micromonospora ureilytica]
MRRSFEDETFSDEPDAFGETEEDLGPLVDTTFDAVVVSTDWTAETILNQISRKTIDVNPSFQRRDAWDRRKKSRFIESLIVGLPVPQIVLAERKGRRGEFVVLDGKQRLLTLQQFTDPESGFKLTGLDVRSDLNGKSYAALPESDRTAFETQTVRTIVVRNWQREEFLYLVFLRLNTESVSLSPQELRQALHPGPFVSFVNQYTAEHPDFYTLFKRKAPDFRMRDVELLVRFYAFSYFLPSYVGNLKPLLDRTCEILNKRWDSDGDQLRFDAESCRFAIAITVNIFGANAFRRWNQTAYERPFNRAVFDVMVFYGRDPAVRAAMLTNGAAVIDAFKEVCNDPEFSESITTTTKSREAILVRLVLWGEALQRAIGLTLPIPRTSTEGRIAYAEA